MNDGLGLGLGFMECWWNIWNRILLYKVFANKCIGIGNGCMRKFLKIGRGN